MNREEAQGASYLRLLEQDKWWRSNDGRVLKLKNMAASHQLNTLAWLLRKAPDFARVLENRALRESMAVEAHHGDDVPDGVFSAMSGWEGEAQAAVDDPEAWMRRQPLFRRLAALAVTELVGLPEYLQRPDSDPLVHAWRVPS